MPLATRQSVVSTPQMRTLLRIPILCRIDLKARVRDCIAGEGGAAQAASRRETDENPQIV